MHRLQVDENATPETVGLALLFVDVLAATSFSTVGSVVTIGPTSAWRALDTPAPPSGLAPSFPVRPDPGGAAVAAP